MTPPLFSLHEFHDIINDEAHGSVGKARSGKIILCPSDHALCGIDMHDLGSCCGKCSRCSAGICKQVQHPESPIARFFPVILNEFPHEIPVCRLFGE